MQAMKPPAAIAADCIGVPRRADAVCPIADGVCSGADGPLAARAANFHARRRITGNRSADETDAYATGDRGCSAVCFDAAMRDDGIGSELGPAKYAATGMDFGAGRGLADEELDDAADAGDLADARYLAAEPDPTELTVEQRVGMAMYGDLWERAGRVAEARLNRRRSA
jgi:hypothetical protein